MKRYSIVGTAAAVLFASSQLASHSAFAVGERAGVAGAVRGAVEQISYSKPTATVGRVVSSGDPIRLGDQIKTGPFSGLQIMLLDQTVFTIGPDAAMVIDKFIYNPKSAKGGALQARILKGTFRFVSGKIAHQNPKGVQLKLKVATLSIRGTNIIGRTGGPSDLVILAGTGSHNNVGSPTSALNVWAQRFRTTITETGYGAIVFGNGGPSRVQYFDRTAFARLLRLLQIQPPAPAAGGGAPGANSNDLTTNAAIDYTGEGIRRFLFNLNPRADTDLPPFIPLPSAGGGDDGDMKKRKRKFRLKYRLFILFLLSHPRIRRLLRHRYRELLAHHPHLRRLVRRNPRIRFFVQLHLLRYLLWHPRARWLHKHPRYRHFVGHLRLRALLRHPHLWRLAHKHHVLFLLRHRFILGRHAWAHHGALLRLLRQHPHAHLLLKQHRRRLLARHPHLRRLLKNPNVRFLVQLRYLHYLLRDPRVRRILAHARYRLLIKQLRLYAVFRHPHIHQIALRHQLLFLLRHHPGRGLHAWAHHGHLLKHLRHDPYAHGLLKQHRRRLLARHPHLRRLLRNPNVRFLVQLHFLHYLLRDPRVRKLLAHARYRHLVRRLRLKVAFRHPHIRHLALRHRVRFLLLHHRLHKHLGKRLNKHLHKRLHRKLHKRLHRQRPHRLRKRLRHRLRHQHAYRPGK